MSIATPIFDDLVREHFGDEESFFGWLESLVPAPRLPDSYSTDPAVLQRVLDGLRADMPGDAYGHLSGNLADPSPPAPPKRPSDPDATQVFQSVLPKRQRRAALAPGLRRDAQPPQGNDSEGGGWFDVGEPPRGTG